MRIHLRFWQSGRELAATAKVLRLAWDKILCLLIHLRAVTDAEKCPMGILHLLAYQRGIERLPGEDESLYRRRVKWALDNALDAGSPAGFARIWERLGLGKIVQEERSLADEWDVILVDVDDSKFAPYRGLFEELVRLYGRTCRRYRLRDKSEPVVISVAVRMIGAETSYYKVQYDA